MNKYYAVLGLPSTASKDEIRRKYRQLVLLWHPDRNPSPEAHAKFIALTEAYDVLMGERPAPRTKTTHTYAPKQKSPHEQRKEKTRNHYDQLRMKFERIRSEHRNARNAEALKNEMHTMARLFFIGAALTVIVAVAIPLLVGSPWNMIWTIPVSIGVGMRMVWKGGRYKVRADMIFGERQTFSNEEIKEFFTSDTGYRYRMMGGGGRR